jgi:hypothetical protein
MENDKTVFLPVKIKKSFRVKVKKVSDAVGKTSSDFVRDAIDEKIQRLAKKDERVAQILEEKAA